MEGILDVLFVQTTFLVDFSGWRRGHGGKGEKGGYSCVAQSAEMEKHYFILVQ